MENYKFKSFLMKRGKTNTDPSDKFKNLSLDKIEEQEKIDNTNQSLISAKLDLTKSNKLLFKNYDILSKEKLNEFGIRKELNNRESYFYFLEYIAKVEIEEDGEIKEKVKVKMIKNKEPNFTIDLSDGKINILKKIEVKKTLEIEENSESFYEEMIKIKNINIEDIFVMKEKLKLKKLRKKMNKYLEELKFMREYKNNFPDFESELFYRYQLENVLKSFKELKDDKFDKKISMIKSIYVFICKVKNNEIRDKNILNYFYFIIDVEYKLKKFVFGLISNYDEKIHSHKDTYANTTENKLIIKNTDIIINNMDYYNLNDNIIEEIKQGILSLPLDKKYYSLKGYLLSRLFTEKEGNKFYEIFVQSNLCQDIIFTLYGLKKDISFWKNVTELLKANTIYVPIKNSSYSAYCDKKCFKIYIDNGIEKSKLLRQLDDKIVYLIKKSFFILNHQHEFGHSHQPLLFFLYPKSFHFDSPLVEIKLNGNIKVETKEGGKIFEYLLFGKIIYEMNIKEIIYICNYNNYSKSLEEYRNDFINLQNKNVVSVFEDESKNNKEILEAYDIYKKLPPQIKDQLEYENFKAGKINPNMIIDFETYKFSSGKERRCPIEDRREIDEYYSS